MDKVICRAIVCFEAPFWVGIFERIEGGRLSAAKHVFGAEPKEHEVYDLILKHYYELRFSPAVETVVKEVRKNPKRIQREVKKQLHDRGIGTKSQQALQLQREQFKTERKKKSREQREADAKRQFELKQQKKRDKHRGR